MILPPVVLQGADASKAPSSSVHLSQPQVRSASVLDLGHILPVLS